MSDATTFYRTFVATANEMVAIMQRFDTLKDRLESDTGLDEAAATAANATGRPDLVAADFINAKDAITQMLFTWDSGSPTQKSYFYKLL